MIGLSSYNVPRKEAWRGWQWNQIVAHLPEFIRKKHKPTKGSAAERAVTSTKTVLYLPGPDHTKDLQCAVSRGFDPTRLIAVDKNAEHVRRVRESGHSAIHGELQNVMLAWRRDWPIDAIVADFCGGFGRIACEFHAALTLSPAVSSKTVVALNMCRGHDEVSNPARDGYLKEFGEGSDIVKHRGMQWWSHVLSRWTDANGVSPVEIDGDTLCAHKLHMCHYGQPQFNSYRSSNDNSNVMFDSLVVLWPFKNGGAVIEDHCDNRVMKKISKLRGSVIATRAVSSRRRLSAVR